MSGREAIIAPFLTQTYIYAQTSIKTINATAIKCNQMQYKKIFEDFSRF